MPDDNVYEIFELVRGREVVILSKVTREQALAHAKLHTRADRRPVHIRNAVTGEVEHFNVSSMRVPAQKS
jgi:hypothetical protein